MSIRERLLGKQGGTTAFQKIKSSWKKSQRKENIETNLHKAYNPLKCRPGDSLELGAIDKKLYEVKKVISYLL